MDIIAFLLVCLSVYISWRLVDKTGYTGLLALLLYVPAVNLFAVLYLAFSEWPVERELRKYRNHFGKFPNDDLAEGLDEESECMQCQTTIPKGCRSCPKCEWSYET